MSTFGGFKSLANSRCVASHDPFFSSQSMKTSIVGWICPFYSITFMTCNTNTQQKCCNMPQSEALAIMDSGSVVLITAATVVQTSISTLH